MATIVVELEVDLGGQQEPAFAEDVIGRDDAGGFGIGVGFQADVETRGLFDFL